MLYHIDYKKRLFPLLNIFVFSLFIISVSDAAIYKTIDSNGETSYTYTPINSTSVRISSYSMNTSVSNTTTEPIQTYRGNSQHRGNSELHSIALQKSDQHSVDSKLVHAVISVESNWNAGVMSSKGAMGLMQLMPETARDLGVINPYDPTDNIDGGVRYLKFLMLKYSGNIRLALAAYNAGPTAVDKYQGIPPYRETIDYVEKVLSAYYSYTNSSSNNNMSNYDPYSDRQMSVRSNIVTVSTKSYKKPFTNKRSEFVKLKKLYMPDGTIKFVLPNIIR